MRTKETDLRIDGIKMMKKDDDDDVGRQFL